MINSVEATFWLTQRFLVSFCYFVTLKVKTTIKNCLRSCFLLKYLLSGQCESTSLTKMVKVLQKKRLKKSKKKIKRAKTYPEVRHRVNTDHPVFAAHNKRSFSTSIRQVRKTSLPAIMENDFEPQFTEELSGIILQRKRRRKTLKKRIITTGTILGIVLTIILILLFVVRK